MKKSLPYLSAFLLGISVAVAQPSLTQAYNYAPGNSFTTSSVDSVGVQPGSSGANQTWNFSGITVGASTSGTALAPSATPYFSDFPTATVAFPGGSGQYQYWKVSGTNAILLGQEQPNQAQVYQNTQILMSWPFTYNSNITDPIACNFLAGGFMDYRTGTSHTVGDGYGTLIMPGGTFNNVLRVHLYYDYSDSVDYGSGFSNVIYTSVSEYHFFDAANKTPYLSIVYISFGTPGNMTGVKAVSAMTSAVGIKDQKFVLDNFDLYPNPSVNMKSNISFSIKESADVSYELLNISGKKIKAVALGNLAAGEHVKALETDEIPAGMYFVDMNVNGMHSKKKIIIE